MIRDDIFNGRFGTTVGVGRADGTVFGDWDHVWEASGIAVDGGGGGKDDVGDIVFGHGREEADGAVNIRAVVLEGDFGGFAHRLCTGLVDRLGA